jgi:hypothetical protein
MALLDEFNKLSNIYLENSIICPKSRNGILYVENNKKHSGWFQYIFCKIHYNKLQINETKNIFIDYTNELDFDNINNLDIDYKQIQLKNNHYKAQDIIGNILNKYLLLLKDNIEKNQSEMSKLCFDKYDDKDNGRNYLTMTLNTILEDYGVVSFYKEKNKKKVNILSTDFTYKHIDYIVKNNFASKNEAKCAKILLNNNINFVIQKRFNDCINIETNKILPFDFYCEDYNLLIEVNGEQHYQFIKLFHKNEDDFIKQQKRDDIKKKYAIDNDIELLILKYDDDFNKYIINKINELKT